MEQVATVDIELIRRIREHISRPKDRVKLLEQPRKWQQLTSALYALEDSSQAIEYYCETAYPEDTKGRYLFIYGLLQALYMQQNAVNAISLARFGKRINYAQDYPEAFRVRAVRNDIEHPMDRDGDRSIYLIQPSLAKDGFAYLNDGPNIVNSSSISVDVFAAITESATCINLILQDSLAVMDWEFREYIDMHRGRKMAIIFANLDYAREKVMQDDLLKEAGYKATKGMVEKCEEELRQRFEAIENLDQYNYLLKEIRAIYHLIDSELLRIPEDLQKPIEKCLLENLFHKLAELRVSCVETDAYFENYGVTQSPDADDSISVIGDCGGDLSKCPLSQ